MELFPAVWRSSVLEGDMKTTMMGANKMKINTLKIEELEPRIALAGLPVQALAHANPIAAAEHGPSLNGNSYDSGHSTDGLAA